MPLTNQNADPWGYEREGYVEPMRVAYAPAPAALPVTQRNMGLLNALESISSVVAGSGSIWTAYAWVHHSNEVARMGLLPPGPLETCLFGVLVWLLVKWCRASDRLRN